ncbi:MAG: FAD-dependent oxidoreductase [Rickettsiales bacterium]|nr:FAD-dependent oxidoreductase [Rickettsiales bacterium]
MSYNIENIEIEELYQIEGLEKFHQYFLQQFEEIEPILYQQFIGASNVLSSAIIIDIAKFVEYFLVKFFGIIQENRLLNQSAQQFKAIYLFKRDFIQRVIAKKYSKCDYDIDNLKILSALDIKASTIDEIEQSFAVKALDLLVNNNNFVDDYVLNAEDVDNNLLKSEDEFRNFSDKEKIELITIYSLWALYNPRGIDFHSSGSLFILPKKLDYQNLVNYQSLSSSCSRNGFDLTDKGFSNNQILSQANYCIFCHRQEKDSCRKGFIVDNGDFKQSPLNQDLTGCPLDQKISEMNYLKSQGYSIGALVVIAIDNPMVAVTGHRICNDCSKSCIFQKQEPVDIPQIETAILKDVLNLPFGFEIYSLLTRWNPFSLPSSNVGSIPKNNTGYKILIAGLGPAGFSLAHYLLNQGHLVVAIDGLKIEPLDPQISGIDVFGKRRKFQAIKNISQIYEPLSTRNIYGFGGVAEYGITVRWDKNFLKIIYIILARRENFLLKSGIRLGSSITEKTIFNDYKFDHLAMCLGAGKPKTLKFDNDFNGEKTIIKENEFTSAYPQGVYLASDFLMGLQLGGAYRKDLFTNLQLRMPVIVIGGGLTAIDSACEARAYYIAEVKKFFDKYQDIIKKIGEKEFFAKLNQQEQIIAQEFLSDALKSTAEINLSTKIFYRKKFNQSPAYKNNHQELNKAIEEGVELIEEVEIKTIIIDSYGHIEAVISDKGQKFACRTLIISAGTLPNINIVTEDNFQLKLDGDHFLSDNNPLIINSLPAFKNKKLNFIVKLNQLKNQDNSHNYQAISYFGDLHPNFSGSVVKAVASAKIGSKQILEILQLTKINKINIKQQYQNFLESINNDFNVTVEDIAQKFSNVIEIAIKAPLIAKNSEVGHIFRLANFHYFAKNKKEKLLATENIPITALEINKERGLIRAMIFDSGSSTNIVKNFTKGEPCIFMGPSGKATELPSNKKVLLIGRGRGNQAVPAIAKHLKNLNCKIIILLICQNNNKISNISENLDIQTLKEASDNFIIAMNNYNSCDIEKSQLRKFDIIANGNFIDLLLEYQRLVTLNQGSSAINLKSIEHLLIIGDDRLMLEIADAKNNHKLQGYFYNSKIIASLNAPMQCMSKGICARCLQRKKDKNNQWQYFYACANQDQELDNVDLQHLQWRCQQNNLWEKLSKIYSNIFF